MRWEIIHGDCLEIMPQMQTGSIDAIVTDPPWPGCKIDTGWLGNDWWAQVVSEMENLVADSGKILIHVNSETDPRIILKPFTLPYIHFYLMPYMPPRRKGKILNEYDIAYQFGNNYVPAGRTLMTECCQALPSIGYNKQMITHPAYRQLHHVKSMIQSQVGAGRKILDPFCGSGTTGVAALINDCAFIGIEKSKSYCRDARSRLKGWEQGLDNKDIKQNQKPLF